MTTQVLEKLFFYPLAFVGIGLFGCIIGIAYLLFKKLSDKPHKELNIATWLSAGLTVIGGLVLSVIIFKGTDLTGTGFRLGVYSPWLAATLGILSGIIIGMIAEYYTSYDYKPTKLISEASKEDPALTITQGLSVGMVSCMAPLIVLGVAIAASYYCCGMFGVAMAAAGMLSFVSTTVSVDTYGPISDNAGGIAEMSELDEEVRQITDKLDSVGNTTAAIGKGFAIGSEHLQRCP